MTERGHVNRLDISIRRTWCGKTRARIVGRADGYKVNVIVTGWRRASVLTEAQATFAVVSADPAEFLEGHCHDVARARTG